MEIEIVVETVAYNTENNCIDKVQYKMYYK